MEKKDDIKKNYLNEERQTKIVIERSKFLSFCYVCESLEQQTKIIKLMKRDYSSATHICYASIIDNNGEKIYANDDGEPSGTAGAQILQAIKENNLINTLCVVVRYFGGIKLGASNLGRTYRDCASDVLKDNFHPVVCKNFYKIICDYPIFDRLKLIVKSLNLAQENINYGVKIDFNIFLSNDEKKKFENFDIEIVPLSIQKYC